jgi:predicted small secreted protein
MRNLQWLSALVLALAAVLAGCNTIAPQDIHTYADAFQEARKAGDLVLDQAAEMWRVTEIQKDETPQGCVKNKTGYYGCFDPILALKGTQANDPPAIQVRRLAVETVSAYNAAILDIAEGRWTTASQLHLDDLTASLTGIIKIAGISGGGIAGFLTPAATQSLTALVGALGGIRDAQLVRRAIIDGAPAVQGIILILSQDTPDLYAIYKSGKLIEFTDGKIDKAAAVTDINAYHDKLEKYVGVLGATYSALDTLVGIAENPGNPGANLRLIVTQAVDIQAKAEAFWKAAHAPASS